MRVWIRRLFILPIKGYKKFISPLLGNNCRFYPTCSEYMMQAIEIHGVIKGILLGTWRILRCNPFARAALIPFRPRENGKTGDFCKSPKYARAHARPS